MKRGRYEKKVLAGLVVLLAAVFAASTVFANDLDHIRAAIKEKGARWVAGETSMSVLPDQERKLRLGHIKPRLTGNEPVLSAGTTGSVGGTAAYTSFDWNDPMKDYVTPVRNQASCGSCWAFAAAGALESYMLINLNRPGQDIDLSEQVLVSCGGGGNCGGGSIGSASNYIRDKGLPLEDCFPYTAISSTCTACYTYQSDTYRIQSWAYVATTSVNVEAIKNALVTYGPLVTTMDVYYDFFSYHSGVYSYTSGAYQGGHAILIVGYDDVEQCFKAKNSWGTGWGESGFFKIAYSAVGNPVYFGEYTIAYMGAAPQPPPPSPDPQPTACTYTISPTSKTFTDKGGKGSISVTTGTSCAWSVSSNASWVRVPSGNSKTGSGTVSYTVDSYTDTSMRSGSIIVNSASTSSTAGSTSIIQKGKRR